MDVLFKFSKFSEKEASRLCTWHKMSTAGYVVLGLSTIRTIPTLDVFQRQFALKKIRCPTGSQGVKEAMREVEAYRRFKHPNIIRILRGNLQDAINANVVNGRHFPEQDMVRLFRGTCLATGAASAGKGNAQPDHDDDVDERFPQAEGDAEGGYSYDGPSAVNVPLVTRHRPDEDGDVVFDGDEEGELGEGQGKPALEIVPYAHRDLKPGNIMIADDGKTPILMDFGSTMKARVFIENRSQALLQQDIAAEQSTMAYRAPELFDVKTGQTLDEKVDIWSLGCTLFALAYSHSPFENTQTTEQGGSIAMAVLNAQYKHPQSAYSQGFRDLIDSMLKVNPAERPDINQVIRMTDRVLQSLA
ncbi:hypothetical protein NLJ89_g7472 [Agrocybe chaxingu]|uniref:non-specific serine/threonine protein kinase n=1 Tax=Agrocybe chaxingu TaxID=84603 RepID=A0A9W8K4E8_9AGAR|nr:hypothetical protein NLJ89_g7472 [Agrocybe chaxingu]